ncbi:Protein CBG26482 [Caenorhabditis briggsae]|uniref:Protein CBG26482 n=1 Tax=Caenorhabditis briggsae TaxID=6238 RepID=B6IH33_CAEBR|nr:Protein CBG26482 [Caenorhabditis briggsae]CAR99213.1 Protein CBG26482 [Caenorhabditis briggsae]
MAVGEHVFQEGANSDYSANPVNAVWRIRASRTITRIRRISDEGKKLSRNFQKQNETFSRWTGIPRKHQREGIYSANTSVNTYSKKAPTPTTPPTPSTSSGY